MVEQLQQLTLDELAPAKDNLRRKVGDVKELAASIEAVGLLEPIVATPNGEGFTVVCGHRRLAAAKVAGLEDVPVIVRDLDEQERLEAMLVENLQRHDLTALEEAVAYRRLVDEIGLSQRELAKRIGRSQSHVSKRLTLLELPGPVVEALDSDSITIEDALEFKPLAGMPKRAKQALQKLERSPWLNVKGAVEEEVREHQAAEARGEVLQKLKQERVEIVDEPSYSDKARILGKDYGQLPFTKTQHRKEPCHAACVVVDRWSGKARRHYVCTDPRRHAAKGASELKAPEGTAGAGAPTVDPRVEAERKALKEAAEARREVIRTITKPRALKTKETIDVLARAVVDRSFYDAQKIACDLLELEPGPNRYGGGKDFRGALAAFVAAAPANLTRAALVLAFADAELSLRGGYVSADGTRALLDVLVQHGHELSEIEQERLKEFDELCPHCGEPECDNTCLGGMEEDGLLDGEDE